jgi:hypothetical protein
LNLSNFDGQRAARDISESLARNTRLQHLLVGGIGVNSCFDWDKLLCDISSIKSTSESNHVLEDIKIQHNLLAFTEQCLKLNQNKNKAQVVRHKILQFYFVGNFDLSPFSSMAVSVLPEVVSGIDGKDNLSAIYRILQSKPEFCNVSGRVVSEVNENKRQKMSNC